MDKITISINIAGKDCYDDGHYSMDLVSEYGQKAKKAGFDHIIVPSVGQDIEAYSSSVKEVAGAVDLPITGFLCAKKFDDVKYTLYAGATKVIMLGDDGRFSSEEVELINECSLRFGKEKIEIKVPVVDDEIDIKDVKELKLFGAGSIFISNYQNSYYNSVKKLVDEVDFPITVGFDTLASKQDMEEQLLSCEALMKIGIKDFIFMNYNKDEADCFEEFISKIRQIEANIFKNCTTAMNFSEFKLNQDGLIPVIVQDYKTDEVLMMAYMNEEAYNKTLETETMTYFSRSRQSLWVKGETSGHFQYVKELMVDCDKDTLLAKVKQIGVACHTGNPTCFYTNLLKKEYDGTNPLKVFQEEYDIILDRKNNPKEGSYTNYLFDKGVDKILKKVGEEATEIVIAAKNPDSEELKYEIADFLYHAMVLMVDKGVTWDEVVEAIAKRR